MPEGKDVNIEDVEGIGPENAASLRGVGITSTEALLERGATTAGRSDIAASTGISAKLVLEWVNHVDLMRIDGVGSEYSDLLEAAGVDSPAELAQRNAANLAQTFQELDAARPDWIRNIPSQATVEGWIEQAKALPKIVTHGGGAESEAAEAAAPAPMATPASAEPAPVSAAEPVPFAAAPPAAAAAPAASTPPAATPVARSSADDGLWARIKRIFGG